MYMYRSRMAHNKFKGKNYELTSVLLDVSFCLLGILLSQLDALEFFTGPVTEQTVFPTINDAVLRCQSSYWEATQTVESSV